MNKLQELVTAILYFQKDMKYFCCIFVNICYIMMIRLLAWYLTCCFVFRVTGDYLDYLDPVEKKVMATKAKL